MADTKKVEGINIKDILNHIIEMEFSFAEEKDLENSNSCLIIPSVYAISGNQINIIKMPFDDETKVQMLKTAGRQCHEWKCHQIAIVTDIAYKQYPDTNMTPDSTELPLTYPRSMRTDALLLQYVDLKNSENNTSIISPYTIENGKIIRKEFEFKEDGKLKSKLIYDFLIGFISHFLAEKIADISIEDISTEKAMSIGDELLKIYPGIKDAPVLSNFNINI